MIAEDVQIQADGGAFDIHARPDAGAFAELIADRVFHPAGRVLAMRDRRIPDVAIDGQGVIRRHQLGPVQRANRVVEIVRRSHFRFENGAQHPHRGPEPEARPVEHFHRPGKGDPAAALDDFTGAQRT